MAQNVNTKRFVGRVDGLQQVIDRLNEMGAALQGKERSKLALEVMGALGEVANESVAQPARREAVSSGIPQPVIDSIFVDAALRARRSTALIGTNKQKTMVEWTATANPKSPKAKVAAGGKVAMSLATMFEFGTSRMRARPFMRPALLNGRRVAGVLLRNKLSTILNEWARSGRVALIRKNGTAI